MVPRSEWVKTIRALREKPARLVSPTSVAADLLGGKDVPETLPEPSLDISPEPSPRLEREISSRLESAAPGTAHDVAIARPKRHRSCCTCFRWIGRWRRRVP